MIKIIIPVFKNRVSPVYDWCSNLLVVEIESGWETGRSKVETAGPDPVRQADQMVELGVGMVVCGGIGEGLLGFIKARNVSVISGVSGDIDDVLTALIAGEIPHPRFMMPGCAGYREQQRVRGRLGS